MIKRKQNQTKLSVDLDNNVVGQPSEIEQPINENIIDENLTQDALDATNFDNQAKPIIQNKKEVWLQPITKKKFIKKLIPFIVFVTFIVALSLFFIIFASIKTEEQLGTKKLNFYLFIPILYFLASPFAFYLFDRAYCQYNLKHNEKMKQKIGKLFVKNYSQNGCFRLKEIYLDNPNQLCWLNNQAVIIENYKRWDPASYEEDIKYYREHKL